MLCYMSSCFCRLTICCESTSRSVRTCTYWILRFVHLKGLLPLCSRALVRRTSNKSECDYFHLHLALGWWSWKELGWQRCSVIWCLLQLTVCSCRISARTVVRLSASRPTRQQDLTAGGIYSMQSYTFKKQIHVQYVTLHIFFMYASFLFQTDPDR